MVESQRPVLRAAPGDDFPPLPQPAEGSPTLALSVAQDAAALAQAEVDLSKTVIRAGFGVFYDVLFTNIIDNIQATAPNAAAPVLANPLTVHRSIRRLPAA